MNYILGFISCVAFSYILYRIGLLDNALRYLDSVLDKFKSSFNKNDK